MSHPAFVNRGDPLGKFIEECGEALAAAGKTVRFGWNSVDPTKVVPDQETNENWLIREIADLEEAIARLKRERGWELIDGIESAKGDSHDRQPQRR